MLIMNEFQTIPGLINNMPIKTVQTDISLHDMNTLIYKIKEQEMRMTAANIFFIDMFECPSIMRLLRMYCSTKLVQGNQSTFK